MPRILSTNWHEQTRGQTLPEGDFIIEVTYIGRLRTPWNFYAIIAAAKNTLIYSNAANWNHGSLRSRKLPRWRGGSSSSGLSQLTRVTSEFGAAPLQCWEITLTHLSAFLAGRLYAELGRTIGDSSSLIKPTANFTPDRANSSVRLTSDWRDSLF